MEAVNVAVVGVTGAVGEVMLEILESRNFPVDTLFPLASSRSCLLYTSPSPRDRTRSRMPSSA